MEENNNSVMSVLVSYTIRDMVKEVNKRNIKKENIVSLVKEKDQFILIFYS